MSSIRAVLIDDENVNLKILEQKIKKLCPYIEVVGQYHVPEDALKALKLNPPDLLFLDIQMPRINGFELLEQLDTISFEIIFVTAFNDYAIKAFKQNAIDYVLKPIDNDDLLTAIDKATTTITNKAKDKVNTELLGLLTTMFNENEKLVVPTKKGLSFIKQTNILHLEGYEGYTKIHLRSGQSLLSSYNLGKFEKLLCKHFFKCHKSHIVNLQDIQQFENEGYLVLSDEKRIPISRSNRKTFLELFNV